MKKEDWIQMGLFVFCFAVLVYFQTFNTVVNSDGANFLMIADGRDAPNPRPGLYPLLLGFMGGFEGGKLLSCFIGALMVIPLFSLSLQLFKKWEIAFLSCLFLIFNLCFITLSTEVYATILFNLLFLLTVYFMYNKKYYWSAFCLLMACSVVSEGIIFFIFFIFLMAIMKKLDWFIILAFILGLAVFFASNTGYVAKNNILLGVDLSDADSVYKIEDEFQNETQASFTELSWNVIKAKWMHPFISGWTILQAVGILAMVFAFIGFCYHGKWYDFLLFIPFAILLYSLTHPSQRYFSHLVPIFCLFAGYGFYITTKYISLLKKGWHLITYAALIVCLVSVPIAWYYLPQSDIHQEPIEYLRAGLWLQNQTGHYVMSRKLQPAYYSGKEYLDLPATLDEILDSKADWVVFDKRISYGVRPDLRYLLNPRSKVEGLTFAYMYNDDKYPLVIWKVNRDFYSDLYYGDSNTE